MDARLQGLPAAPFDAGGGVIAVSMHLSAIVERPTPRRGLPEHSDYEDTGCELSPSCLRCPLAICKYDDPKVFGMKPATVVRRVRILQHRRLGKTMREIAVVENISVRTVYLACRDAKELVA